ncbi:hypothetical protein MXB_2652 [Myxobolus squamalis]|nr:hypothetical protein MXB_2652 [Myxobolus squamalis]
MRKNKVYRLRALLVVQRDNIYSYKSEYVYDEVAVIPVKYKDIQECTQSLSQGYATDHRMNDADVYRHIIGKLKEQFQG